MSSFVRWPHSPILHAHESWHDQTFSDSDISKAVFKGNVLRLDRTFLAEIIEVSGNMENATMERTFVEPIERGGKFIKRNDKSVGGGR
jgi:hypothetical protein